MGKENTGFIIQISDTKWKAIVEYPPEDGKRVKKTKTVNSEAKAKRALVDLNLAKERYLKEQKEKKNRLPFKEAASVYIDRLDKKVSVRQLKKKTVYDYKQIISDICNEFELFDLYKITSEDLDKYFDRLLYTEKYTPSTVSKYRTMLSGIYKANKIIMPQTEPIPNAHKRNLSRVRPLEAGEQQLVETYINDVLKADIGKRNKKWQIIYLYYVGVYTGCREGELAGLKWSSVKKDEGILLIDNNLGYIPHEGLLNDTPKTATSLRRLVVSKKTFKVLEELKEVYKKYNYPESEYVFITRNGTQMSPRNILRDFQDMCKKAGVTNHHTFHDLRHTNVTTKIMAGVDVKTVSLMAGHADTSITLNTYTHYWKEAAQRAANLFEDENEEE